MPIPAGYQETLHTPQSERRIEASWSFCAKERGSAVVLPDGRCDIIMRGGATGVWTPVVTGPATEPYQVSFEKGDRWIGLRLLPMQAVSLWKNGLPDALNTAVRSGEVESKFPNLRLTGVTNASTLRKLVNSLGWPDADPKIAHVVDLLHTTGGRASVASLGQRVGWSVRHLNRQFRSYVGLTTKTYAQLIRFHRALRLIRLHKLPITAAAYEAGYADHAHLCRAFDRFGGFNPSAIPPDIAMPDLTAQ